LYLHHIHSPIPFPYIPPTHTHTGTNSQLQPVLPSCSLEKQIFHNVLKLRKESMK
jgi:hypothetical protein